MKSIYIRKRNSARRKFLYFSLAALLFSATLLSACKDQTKDEKTEYDYGETTDNTVQNEFDLKNYSGIWYSLSNSEDIYGERYRLAADGTFIFSSDLKDEERDIFYMTGVWDCKDGLLELSVQEKISKEYRKALHTGSNFISFNNVKYSLDRESRESITIPVTSLTADRTFSPPKVTMFIDGKQFWRYKDDEVSFSDFYKVKYSLINSHIIKESSEKPINENELLSNGKFGVSLAKNELFARKGYIFEKKELNGFFRSMPWYKANEEAAGDLASLTDMEKENFKILDDYDLNYDSYKKNITESFEDYEADGVSYLKETAFKDLNGDFVKERITVHYKLEDIPDEQVSKECRVVIETMTDEYTVNVTGNPLKFGICFADFDIYDSAYQFYFDDEDPDGRGSEIYSFTKNGIQEDLKTKGTVEYYNGTGRIFTEYNYTLDKNNTVNSYYSLKDGFVPLDDSEYLKSELVFKKGLALMSEAKSYYLTYAGSKNYSDAPDNLTDLAKESLVTILPPETPMEVTDVVFEEYEGSYLPDPWIKVRTQNNEEGWFRLSR